MVTVRIAVFLATFHIALGILNPWEPEVDPALRCPYGRHHTEIGNQANCNLLGVSCTEGYFCSGDTQDKNGRCCKTHNPCTTGAPYHVEGDAPACLRGDFRCPHGYTCVGTAYSSSVCCPGSGHSGPYIPDHSNQGLGCIADGGLYQPGEVFYNIAGDRCTCTITGRATCIPNSHKLPSGADRYCTAFDRSYRPGQRFVASDGCNECTCEPDGGIQCSRYPCPDFSVDRRHGTPGQLYCTFEDIHYSRGQTFTSTDGCRQCTCGNNGRVSCQRRQCNGFPDPGSSIGFPIGLPDGRRPIALPDGRTQRVGFPEDRDSIGFPRSGGQIGFSNSGSSISRGGDHGHDHGHSHK